MKQILQVIVGCFYWIWLCIIHHISYKSVVLVLSDENAIIDKYAVEYFELFAERKFVKNKKIIWFSHNPKELVNNKKLEDVELINVKKKSIDLLYNYYCFDKFFDNIVFTYTSKPDENMLQKVLDETSVTEKDAVFLALFHLRQISKDECHDI